MSLNWLHQKIIKSKAVDPNSWFKPLDLKSERLVSECLKNAIFSVTTDEEFTDSESKQELEDVAEIGCSKIDSQCQKPTEVEIYIAPKRDASSGVVSLIPTFSSEPIIGTDFDREAFFWITYLVPLRNESVIIHWKVKSTHGVRGFQVHVDGKKASTIHWSERSSELIKNINMEYPHHFTVSIVPKETMKLVLPPFETATYFYDPR